MMLLTTISDFFAIKVKPKIIPIIVKKESFHRYE